ncbi:PAS domain-containing protein [Gilvimarinus sp. SDUM040013]|uniref:histidine kinase n=1 Tax=Gilvimarinus gilvus TaxID=3058038 RepID=A0ABU4RZT7_9GAMM|nr:PAS domain-containing protein [Gilvimarinus sp. SDUM040013]MDO3385139.1 PAS domain-containing protein [Gilvimarinus sp. SDUM040013]MDX6848514.1 PAS domain-containing protein [Gilvimarinus sp. SDUM040013]
MNGSKHSISPSQELDHMAPQELRELVQRYRRIFSGSGYGFWEWDLSNSFIDWSGTFWEHLGYTDEDRKGFTDSRMLPNYIHPDDIEDMYEAVREHLRTAEPLNTCYRVKTKAGDYIWTQVRADSIRDESGRAAYISGVNFDITELKQTEAALRESQSRQARIIQASKDGIWEWYPQSNGFQFSARCWEHLGFTEEDDIVNAGQDRMSEWRSYMHKEDLLKFDAMLKQHLRGFGPFDVEYRIYDKHGDIRWIRARGKASFDVEGRPTRMSGTNMDITDIKRAEERVIKAKELAEKANRAKSDFLSSMSHELRTPLNAILGYAQLFEYDENLQESHKENIREIRSAGEHLLKLINDVLDLAKIESGAMSTVLQPVLVSRLLVDCFTLVQPQADARGIYLHSDFSGLENTCVAADQVRLKQALLNLMSNAIKYNKVGGEVKVSLSATTDNYLRIEVQDTGLGIDDARRDEVFQPFNRLNAEMSKVEGSGVGLVITKQLVEMMQGRIDFSSEVGSGTCFWLELQKTGEAEDARTLTAASDNFDTGLKLKVEGNYRVLYIEDNLTNIRLLQHFFSYSDNFQLEVYEEPYQGIFHARQSRPDLIVLDINLPGLDGYDVLSVLQSDPATRDIPVVGLSANVMSIDIEKGRAAGFYEYLTKPLQIAHMVDVLNRLFGAAGPDAIALQGVVKPMRTEK